MHICYACLYIFIVYVYVPVIVNYLGLFIIQMYFEIIKLHLIYSELHTYT